MAQARFSNVLPCLPNRNVNGISERMKEREKAHLARERNVEQNGKKVPSFPSPVRVEENDGISTSIKNVLGTYNNFKRIMISNKGPDNIIGVEPVPATPTEPKSYFGSDQAKDKRVRLPDKKKEVFKGNEQKVDNDLLKHKTTKLNNGEHSVKERKLHDIAAIRRDNKERKEQKDRHPDKREVTKNSKTTDDTNDKCSVPPVTTKTQSETTAKGQNEKTITKNVHEKPAQKSPFKIKRDLFHTASQKIRPTPLLIPPRDMDISVTSQNVQHSDMKVQSILKEMTEPVAQPPLTGICTPISKKVFPFSKDKDDLPIPNATIKSPTQDNPCDNIENKVDEVDAVQKDDDNRNDKDLRSRSSSSSDSSSSEDDDSGSESDSESEEASQPKLDINSKMKVSNLNAISPSTASVCPVVDKSKSFKVEAENEKCNTAILSCPSNNDECISENHSNNSNSNSLQRKQSTLTNDDNSVLDFRIKTNFVDSNQQDTEEGVKVKNEQLQDDNIKMDTTDDTNTGPTNNSTTKMLFDNDNKGSLNMNLHKESDDNDIKPKQENQMEKGNGDCVSRVSKPKSDKLLNERVGKDKHKTKRRLSGSNVKKEVSGNRIVSKDINGERSITDKYSDEAENSDVDVVTWESPAKRRKTEKVNGDSRHHDPPVAIKIIHDREKEPKSLVVKISLSLLKRKPRKEVETEGLLADTTLSDEKRDTSVLSEMQNTEKKLVLDKQNTEKVKEDEVQDSSVRQTAKQNLDPQDRPSKRVCDERNSDEKGSHDEHYVSQATIFEQNTEVEEDIRRTSPNTHLCQAKTLKREADKLADIDAKTLTYINAIIRFICCGRALETNDENRAAQMYSETEDLLKFVLKRVLTKTSGQSEYKRLTVLCLRIQSLLLHKLYRLKSKQTFRNSQLLSDHFQASHKNNTASPYTVTKHGSTPSPLSPTPSPAGSIGSVGSSSSEGNNGTSQSNRVASQTSSITSPVSISIPQRVHTVMSQYVSTTNKLLYSIDIWDKADNLTTNNKDFFSSLDSLCGALTFHSSIAHVVNYARKTLSKLQDNGKNT